MSKKREADYSKYSTGDLVGLYQRAASEHGTATTRGEHRAGNAAADRIAAIYRQIRSRGLEHQRMLLPLLLSPDIGVSVWAAAHALEFEPQQGEAILSEVAKGKGVHAFNAKMTLKVWRDGNLRFP